MEIEMTKIKRDFYICKASSRRSPEENETVRANRCRELTLELAGVGCHDNDACQHEINH